MSIQDGIKQLSPILEEITGSVLYRKPRVGVYEPWYRLATLLSGVLNFLLDSEDGQVNDVMEATRSWAEVSLTIPKYHRDSEFRRGVRTVMGLIEVLDELLARLTASTEYIAELEQKVEKLESELDE